MKGSASEKMKKRKN